MNTYVKPLNGGLVERANVVRTAAAVDLSVVMVVFRTGPALQESLARVLDDPTPDEFVIIDNGSRSDEEVWQDQAAAQDARVRVIRGHGNVGFARGANMGAVAANGRILTFLNPDAFIEGDCFSNLRSSVDAAPSPRIVGARVLNVDGTEQRGGRRGEVTPVTTLLSLTRLAHLKPFRGFEIHAGYADLGADHLRRLFRHDARGFFRHGRFRRGLLPPCRGCRPMLARAQKRRRCTVRSQRPGGASGLHQPHLAHEG
jgi:glycosyltransferase involved in cell wall biosynthesis